MAIKLIASDLDGTLLAPDHLTVTDRTKDALLKAHNAGCKIAIATGRTLDFIGNVTEQIPFCDYIIYSNGASVFDVNKSENIYENHIPNDISKEIIDLMAPMQLYYNCYVDGKVLVQKNKINFYKERDLPEKFLEYFQRASVNCESIKSELADRDVEIIAIYSANEQDLRLLTECCNKYCLHVTSSIPGEIEINAASVNKGKALEGLCSAEGFDKDSVMTFGDAQNDYEMLAFTKNSYAMENAHESCKKVAGFITASNAEDGVALAIENSFT